MDTDGTREPPLYMIPDEGQDGGVNLHTPSDHSASEIDHSAKVIPVYTSGGGGLGADLETGDGKMMFVRSDRPLGSSPGMATCTSCNQQVMTNVSRKAGRFAWQMIGLFIILALLTCLLPLYVLPFVIHQFKDIYHTCPRCNEVLHVEKMKCCKART